MNFDRRDFLAGSAALGSGMFFGCSVADSRIADAALTAENADFATARAAFPWSTKQAFLNNAGRHPCGVHSVNGRPAGISTYILDGPGDGAGFGEKQFHEVKGAVRRTHQRQGV